MASSESKCSSQFHQAVVGRCCQLCGEYQQTGPLDRTLSDGELKKMFPRLTARGASGRPSRLTCPACYVKIYKFRTDCQTKLGADNSITTEERQTVVAATRWV